MLISEYCRLLLRKYPNKQNVGDLVNLVKEMRWAEGILSEIQITGDTEWLKEYPDFPHLKVYGGMAYRIYNERTIEYRINLKVVPFEYKMVELVCTLAHEAGHFLSMNERPTIQKRIAYGKDLVFAYTMSRTVLFTKTDWEVIMAEEMIAWAYARKLLKAINFKDWNQFEAYRKEALTAYDWNTYNTEGI